jgi:hypothetical protein
MAQVTVSFNIPVYGQSLEGISFVQLFNGSNEDVKARLTVRIRESKSGTVLTAIFSGIPLRKGGNILDRASFSRGRFTFGNNYHGQTLSQTGRLPEGEYEYCFEMEITESKSTWLNPYFENCFVQQLQPMTPLLLVNPADGDENCNTRPSFLWQLPFPLPAEARCRLVLSELKDKQDIAEAINYNIPLINQGNILGNQLIFPSGAPALKEGKRYVWQVIVYIGKAILKRSEIWTYAVKCEEIKKEPVTDSYRELKESDDGNFYIAHNILRFSFHNPYSAGVLSYSIASMTDPSTTIKGLPKFKMQTGLNKYDLDLSENKSFKKGQEYILKVRLTGNREMRLRFLFTNE